MCYVNSPELGYNFEVTAVLVLNKSQLKNLIIANYLKYTLMKVL